MLMNITGTSVPLTENTISGKVLRLTTLPQQHVRLCVGFVDVSNASVKITSQRALFLGLASETKRCLRLSVCTRSVSVDATLRSSRRR